MHFLQRMDDVADPLADAVLKLQGHDCRGNVAGQLIAFDFRSSIARCISPCNAVMASSTRLTSSRLKAASRVSVAARSRSSFDVLLMPAETISVVLRMVLLEVIAWSAIFDVSVATMANAAPWLPSRAASIWPFSANSLD